MKKTILSGVLLIAAAVSAFAQRDSVKLAMPWNSSVSAENATGGARCISGDVLEKNVSSDLRGRLTGIIPGLEVTENGGGMFSAATSSLNSYNLSGGAYDMMLKGFTSMYCIVDDVPVAFNQLLLDPNQIESITVLSDVLDKVKYGPMASYNALYIKTKSGQYGSPLRVSLDVESGVSQIGLLPEWVSGYDYAVMNNSARSAAGLSPIYGNDQLEGILRNDPYDLAAPNVDYKSLMLRSVLPVNRFAFSASAGSKDIKYAVAVNGINSGDIVKSEEADYNKLNLSASVSTRIGRYMEAGVSFKGLVSFRRTGNTSWYNYRSVPAVAFPLILDTYSLGDIESYNPTGEKVVYGVSKTFGNNYYAKMIEGGVQTTRNRSGFFDAHLDVDWSWLLKGLSSRTCFEYSSFLSTKIGKNNDYIAYYWDQEIMQPTEISDHKGDTQTSRSTSASYTGQNMAFYHRFAYDWARDGHAVNSGITYYMSNGAQTGDTNYQKQLYLVANLGWNYGSRYSIEAAAQYAGSSRFAKGSRFGFFPSVGASWNIHNEKFFSGARDKVSKLKLRAQVGEMGTADVFGAQYLYQASYSTTAGMYYGGSSNGGDWWFGTNTHRSKYTDVYRLANPDLSWARVFQTDVALEMQLFNCLDLGAEFYKWERKGIITDITTYLPSLFGLEGTSVYGNFEERATEGVNIYAQFDKKFGDFRLGAGASLALGGNQIYSKLVNDSYSEEYQKKTGTSIYSIWGYKCIGKYESQEEIDNLPSYTAKSELAVGDLKYEDVNGDGVINTNDRVFIGNSAPKFSYSVNLSLAWKNLDLRLIGTGRAGFDLNLSDYDYFVGGSGMGNYSAFIRDELGGQYPRLSYNTLTNNNLQSDFWLRKGDWFKLQSADLGYTFDMRRTKAVQSVRVDLRGDNLFTITKVDYVDPECIAAGLSAYPLFRTFTLGAKIIF